jgi:hypothetical protein
MDAEAILQQYQRSTSRLKSSIIASSAPAWARRPPQ